jgi:hypothetical protein
MVGAVELRRIAAFSDLPDGQIDWFLSHAEEMILQVNTGKMGDGAARFSLCPQGK